MKPLGKITALFLLAAFVAGCRHKAKTTLTAAEQAPTIPVSQSIKNLPPPKLPPPETPDVGHPAPPPPPSKPKSRKARHKVKHVEVPAEQAPVKSPQTEVADNTGTGNDITPIGQLSAAGESTNTPRRNRILDEIDATEKGLDDIKRPLSKEEQTTATQIRTFLTKAKESLNQEDLDGAQILVTKAKVLLQELTKS